MKTFTLRTAAVAALAVLLSCIFAFSALAETACVMESSRVYQEASTSSRSVKVSVGTQLEVLAEKNGWAMVKKGGNTGYIKASVLADVETYSNTTVYTTAKAAVYKKCSASSKKLGTLPTGTGLTLEATAGEWAYVRSGSNRGYVKKNLLTTKAPEKEPEKTEQTASDSVQKVNMTAYAAKDGAKVYKTYSSSAKVLGTLDQNTAVKVTAIKGDWCRVEKNGITAFMKKSDLSETKVAAADEKEESSGESTSKPASGKAKEMDWWTSGIQQIFARETVATITDVETGISWQEIRKGGTNHADVQPLTAEDTAAMKKAVGGSWSWNRRAIWVTINGEKYAASMNCMPHGAGSIKNNNFNGHHCIHFTNSRTHGGNKVCSKHQAAIKKAAAAGN